MKAESSHDIIVIGGGVAGLTAALYALRSGRSVLVLEKEAVGGQIANSPRVENFPSQSSISGIDLADSLFNQVLEQGGEFELENVESAEKIGKAFEVKTDYALRGAKSVIIATGVHHKKLRLPKEEELKGISYCAVCDGAFYKGEEVVLIGDANTALQYILLMSNYCKKVTVLTLFDRFFGDKVLIDRVLQRENVLWLKEAVTVAFEGEKELSGVTYKDKEGALHTVNTRAAFIAIGQAPDNKVFSSLVALDKEGYIAAGEDCVTSCEGIFAAGDCRSKKVRQLTTACADGAVAALAANAYIDSL